MAKVLTISDVYYLLRNGVLTKLRHNKKGPSALTTETLIIEAYAIKEGYINSEVSSATFLIYNPRKHY